MPPPATPQEIGQRIRELRIEQRIPPTRLAAAAGIGERTLYDLERGRASAQTFSRLSIIAAELGIDLFKLTGPPPRRRSRPAATSRERTAAP